MACPKPVRPPPTPWTPFGVPTPPRQGRRRLGTRRGSVALKRHDGPRRGCGDRPRRPLVDMGNGRLDGTPGTGRGPGPGVHSCGTGQPLLQPLSPDNRCTGKKGPVSTGGNRHTNRVVDGLLGPVPSSRHLKLYQFDHLRYPTLDRRHAARETVDVTLVLGSCPRGEGWGVAGPATDGRRLYERPSTRRTLSPRTPQVTRPEGGSVGPPELATPLPGLYTEGDTGTRPGPRGPGPGRRVLEGPESVQPSSARPGPW